MITRVFGLVAGAFLESSSECCFDVLGGCKGVLHIAIVFWCC